MYSKQASKQASDYKVIVAPSVFMRSYLRTCLVLFPWGHPILDPLDPFPQCSLFCSTQELPTYYYVQTDPPETAAHATARPRASPSAP